MHTRYYSYLIPLAVVVLIEAAVNLEPKVWKWAKYSVVLIFSVVAGVNLFTAAMPYSSNWVDAPDFRMHIDIPAFSTFTIVVALGATILWLWHSRAAMVVAIAIAIVSAVFTGAHNTNFLSASFGNQTSYDHVARILYSFLPQSEADEVVMVGKIEMLQRTVFSSLTGSPQIRSGMDVLDRSEVESSNSWLIAFEDQVVTGFEQPTISGQGFKMYSLDSQNSITPKEKTIESFTGLCPDSSDKAWSCGNETKLSLLKPFSAKATVDLIFEVSEWAAGKELEFVLGDSAYVGQFDKGMSTVLLRFANTNSSDELTIRVINSGEDLPQNPPLFIRPVWGYTTASK